MNAGASGGLLPSLIAALRAELAARTAWGDAELIALADKGLAHHHVRLRGTGLLARIPKQSQLGLPPEANLVHQRACFERAAAGGHAPKLHGVLPVSARLPRGALLVEEIVGAPAVLPRDLDAIATSLGAMHALPLPPPNDRAPLAAPTDPLRDLVDEIARQARHLPDARLPAAVAGLIERELGLLQQQSRRPDRPAVHLISFDAHPGNFVVRPSGQAVLVDLEKCRYGPAGLDLAHATLYTSTTWDPSSQATLDIDQVGDFHAAWGRAVGPATADAARPWHVPLRHAMWLWSLTWCCKWRALSDRPPQRPEAGEDWSQGHSDAALVAHVRDRVAHYLSPAAIDRVLDELQALRAVFGR